MTDIFQMSSNHQLYPIVLVATVTRDPDAGEVLIAEVQAPMVFIMVINLIVGFYLPIPLGFPY